MGNRVADLVLAIVLVAIGAFILIDINSTEQTGHSVIESVGFATLPSIYAGLLVALSGTLGGVALLGLLRERSVRRKSGSGNRRTAPRAGGLSALDGLRTVGTIVAVLVYALLLKYVNFFALTAVFLLVMFHLYGQRSLLRTGVVALVGAAAFHALFVMALKLPF